MPSRTIGRTVWLVVVSVFVLLTPLEGQAPDPPAPSQEEMVTVLEGLARDDWSVVSKIERWPLLRHAFDAELDRNPNSPLSALIRKAAVRVDVKVSSVIVRHWRDVVIELDRQPRFELDAPIPYVAVIHASIDGGAWSTWRVFHESDRCYPRLPLRSDLASGIHRMNFVVDIAYIRKPIDAVEPFCTPDSPAGDLSLTQIEPANVLGHDRHVLPGVSFAISPDLLGAPDAAASSLEVDLPEIPISLWLHDVLAPFEDMKTLQDWHADFCRDEEAFVYGFSDWRRDGARARRTPRDVCLTYAAGIKSAPPAAVRLRVATVIEDTGVWTLETPTLADVSVGGGGKFLAVPRLNFLPQIMPASLSALPSLDVAVLESDLRYAPIGAKPGDPITITAVIRNIGGVDGRLTTGMLLMEPASTSDWPLAVARDFVVDVLVDGTAEVSVPATMPESGFIVALVHGTMLPFAPAGASVTYGGLSDANMENNEARKKIGSKF